MKKRKQNNTGYALASAAAIFLFAVVLWVAISSISAVGGGIKRASTAPDSLLSAGAPRSQLELKRFFESIGLTYTEDGKKVWEPVSSEYRRAVERLSESGDRQLLSVEEVLFIIADSRTAYDSFDVIRFRSGSGEVEEEILPVVVPVVVPAVVPMVVPAVTQAEIPVKTQAEIPAVTQAEIPAVTQAEIPKAVQIGLIRIALKEVLKT